MKEWDEDSEELDGEVNSGKGKIKKEGNHTRIYACSFCCEEKDLVVIGNNEHFVVMCSVCLHQGPIGHSCKEAIDKWNI